MKKISILSLFAFATFSVQAQEKTNKDTTSIQPNRFVIEFTTGQSKGLNPYTEGYFSNNNEKAFGSIALNSINLGFRYMISPTFGVKADIGYLDLKNNKKSISLPFEMQVYTFGVQGVINASKLFNIEKPFGRLGLLLHGGVQISQMNSKTSNEISGTNPITIVRNHNSGLKEYNGGLIIGFSPQLRLTNKIALISDVSFVNNFRQHFAWDGAYSATNNNLSGQLVSLSLGLTFSLGKEKMHGDWAIIKDENLEKINLLNEKVKEIETLMNDTDKDGVADYLDQENNSVAGVTVDSRGKMVDINRNGVPDELERYIIEKTKESSQLSNTDMIKKLINLGYVTTYFDTAKVNPTNVSTEGIDFIRTYLLNNPSDSIDIIGHADEIGANEYNNKLSKGRSLAVKDILVKSGIDVSRLNIVVLGEDNSVSIDSSGARKLVRRVTFKIK